VAELVLKNVFVNLSTESSTGTPYNASNKVTSVTLTYEGEILDKTAMGSSFRKRISGLKNWNASLELNMDYADTSVEDRFWDYIGSSGTYLTIRPSSATIGASNPRYHGSCLLESLPVISGGVGELAKCSVTLQGNGSLTRAES
jgi:hypothetical protein